MAIPTSDKVDHKTMNYTGEESMDGDLHNSSSLKKDDEIIDLIKKNICRLECNLNSIVNQSDQSNPIINVHFDGSRQIIKTLYGLLEYIDIEEAKHE